MVYRARLDAQAGSGEAYRWLKLVGAEWLNQFGIEEKQVQVYIERIEQCQTQ